MGASSRSPSPMTMVPFIGTESMVCRMASVATWSECLRSPWPMVLAEAMAASSTTRTNSSASSNSSRAARLPFFLTPCVVVAIRFSWSEGVEAGDLRADDERVDVVRALIRLHRLQVHHVAHDGVVVGHAIGAEDVARQPRALQRHADVVPLRVREVVVLHFA